MQQIAFSYAWRATGTLRLPWEKPADRLFRTEQGEEQDSGGWQGAVGQADEI